MPEVFIYGAGGLGKELFYFGKQIKQKLVFVGFIDDFSAKEQYCLLPLYKNVPISRSYVIGIVNPKVKRSIIDRFPNEHFRDNLIHNSIDWEHFNMLGMGNIIFRVLCLLETWWLVITFCYI